jgi:hypothetical protein
MGNGSSQVRQTADAARVEARSGEGPCAKAVVRCTLIATNGARFIGENRCANPQASCPRASGEGYEKCTTICRQLGHAETEALEAAGSSASGAHAFVEGRSYVCRSCQEALFGAGVRSLTLGSPPRSRRNHILKTWPEPFMAVRSGLKTWELRKDDRGFEVGDTLTLTEFDPATGDCSGEVETRAVTWLLRGGQFGLPVGYVVMSMADVDGASLLGDRRTDGPDASGTHHPSNSKGQQ